MNISTVGWLIIKYCFPIILGDKACKNIMMQVIIRSGNKIMHNFYVNCLFFFVHICYLFSLLEKNVLLC